VIRSIVSFSRAEAGRLLGSAPWILLAAAMALPSTVLAGPSNLRRELWRGENLAVADGSGLAASDTLIFAYTGDRVAAFDKTDGSTVWASPTLESSASFISTSSPLYVASEGQVAIGSGLGANGTLYLLDETNGDIVHSAPLGKAVVNASPAYANGLYYIKSFPDFGVPATSSLYAIRASDGGIAWQADDGGNGGGQPVINGGVLYDFVWTGSFHEVRAYDAATGAPMWTSDLQPDIEPFGGLTLGGDGFLYFGTNDFFDSDPLNPTSELFRLSASNGAFDWEVAAAASNGQPAVGGGMVFAHGAFSYGQLMGRSATTGDVVWSRSEGFWNTSPVLDGAILYYCGDPEAGLGNGPQLYAVDAATGAYLDSVHRPIVHGTPLVESAAVYVTGGGFVRAFGEAPELLKIYEVFVTSDAQDYLWLQNATFATVELAGWRVEADFGDGAGYQLAATLPAFPLPAVGLDRIGDMVLIGAEENPLLGLGPEIDLASFDLPDLTGANTVKGVRLVNPAGDVIDSVLYIDGTASGENPNFAADDTGEASANRAVAGLMFAQALRRSVPADSNDSATDFQVVGFPTAAQGWELYE
jgi:outer membrane protein assembly factor BamB